MNVRTQSPVTLLRASLEEFTGRDSNTVKYHKAVILDDEGNKFECAASTELGQSLLASGLEKVDGTADFEVFIGKKGDKSILKMRLVAFKPK